MEINSPVVALNLLQAQRAIVTCFAANVPVFTWGSPGSGKSSCYQQIAKALNLELFDVRLSDKEPSDFAIPYPDADKGVVKWMVTDLLPFQTIYGDVRCLLMLDEIDRAEMSLQNMALQLLFDRRLGRHQLSPNCVIGGAGNGVTDIGTSPLSDAAANRICHLYIEEGTQGAAESWEKWATTDGKIPEAAVGFARFRPELFGQRWADKHVEELAYLSRRSYEQGVRVYFKSLEVSFPTEDIRLALVAGCMGKAPATEFLGFMAMHDKAPSALDIFAHPEDVAVPEDPGVRYALTIHLAGSVKTREQGQAVVEYGRRWPRESAAYLMKLLVDKLPEVVTTPAYTAWVRANG